MLAEKISGATMKVCLLLAHNESRVGMVAREQLGVRAVPGVDAIVVPGLVSELPRWVSRLALAGPVVDCTNSSNGLLVIVIDRSGATSLCTLPLQSSPAVCAMNSGPGRPEDLA